MQHFLIPTCISLLPDCEHIHSNTLPNTGFIHKNAMITENSFLDIWHYNSQRCIFYHWAKLVEFFLCPKALYNLSRVSFPLPPKVSYSRICCSYFFVAESWRMQINQWYMQATPWYKLSRFTRALHKYKKTSITFSSIIMTKQRSGVLFQEVCPGYTYLRWPLSMTMPYTD